MMKPTALRDRPTFQSVGECVCEKESIREYVRELRHICSYTTEKELVPLIVHMVHIKHRASYQSGLDDTFDQANSSPLSLSL